MNQSNAGQMSASKNKLFLNPIFALEKCTTQNGSVKKNAPMKIRITPPVKERSTKAVITRERKRTEKR